MLSPKCLVVGGEMPPFAVDVEESGKVGDLVDALKKTCSILANCNIQLSAAGNSAGWLPLDSPRVHELTMEDFENFENVDPLTCLHPKEMLWNVLGHVGPDDPFVHILVTGSFTASDDKQPVKPIQLLVDEEQQVEIWCLILGLGCGPISLKMATTDSIEVLQDRIAAEWLKSLEADASTQRLFLAKEDGRWLAEGEPEEADLEIEIPDLDELQEVYGHHLDPKQTLGSALREIDPLKLHILVAEPDLVQMCKYHQRGGQALITTEDAVEHKHTVQYRECAEMLKDSGHVNQLVRTIHRAQDTKYGTPFVSLEGSRGTGKTQMAFNLMARDDLDVFYIVFERTTPFEWHQPVYRAFITRSATFRLCVKKDLVYVRSPGIADIISRKILHSYGFIYALLMDKKATYGVRARSDVHYAIAARRRKCRRPIVFFLDEVPFLADPKNDPSTQYILFMRNVLRSFDLTVVMSSRNATARDVVSTEVESLECDAPLRCIVFPLSQQFQDPYIEGFPDALKVLVKHSRPLFAKAMVTYVNRRRWSSGVSLADYMDKMVEALARQFPAYKNPWGFLVGQLCLFLPARHIQDEKCFLVHNHFACLSEEEPFNLRYVSCELQPSSHDRDLGRESIDNSRARLVKEDSVAWTSSSVFPKVEKDVLLYLCSMGGKLAHPFEAAPYPLIPFRQAFQRVLEGGKSVLSPTLCSSSAAQLESLVVGATVLASHRGGFGGIQFENFLLSFSLSLASEIPTYRAIMNCFRVQT